MTAFVSQRPNTDPKPWEWNGFRYTRKQRATFPSQPCNWDPRPEYTQTRDTHPWLHTHVSENCFDTGSRMRTNNGIGNEWDPRHGEFDPPVNRILAAFRADERTPWGVAFDARHWLGLMWHGFTEATQDEIDHARRVLSKLAAVSQ